MQKSEIRGLGQSATSERGKAYKTAKAGRKSYSRRSSKASSQSRGRGKGRKAGGGRKRQRGRRDTAYKLAELLPTETIRKLKELKR